MPVLRSDVPDLLAQVRMFVREHRMPAPGEAAVVAVSGGCDSMVLLDVLQRLARPARWRLTVAHFNHLLRGRASDADERLVIETAKRLRLPVVTGRGSVRAHAKQKRLSIEMAARELRHQFLATSAREAGAFHIFVAHHADDQVETFFLRLLRGSTGEGLGGMKPVAASPVDPELTLLRPLLLSSRLSLTDYARSRQIQYRVDASNAALAADRNFVRSRLLPLLERRVPAFASVVARTMAIVSDESLVVAQTAEAWLANPRQPRFEELPVAVQRRVLAAQLREEGIEPCFEWLERLRQQPERGVTVASRVQVTRRAAGRLEISRAKPKPPAAANPQGPADSKPAGSSGFSQSPGSVTIDLTGSPQQFPFDGLNLSWEVRSRTASDSRLREIRTATRRERFDADMVGNRITLRHWQPGDRFQPLGMKRPVKLQDLFVNAKVPQAERRNRVLALTPRGEVFWVEGLRISEPFKLTAATQRVLDWRWNRQGGRVAADFAPC